MLVFCALKSGCTHVEASGRGRGRGEGRRDGERTGRREGGKERRGEGGEAGGKGGRALRGPERRLCKVEMYRGASASAVHASRLFRRRDSGDTLPMAWITVTQLQGEGGRLGNAEGGNR